MLSSPITVSVFYNKSVCNQFTANAFFTKISEKHPIFIYDIFLRIFFDIASFLIIITTAIRIIIRLRSSPLPDSESLHRRQENKLTWLTFKICGVFVVCWLPRLVSAAIIAFSGIHGNIAIDALVIASTVSYYFYVFNPLLHYSLLNRRTAVNSIPRPADREAMGIQVGAMNVINDTPAINTNSNRQAMEIEMNCSDIA